MWEASFEVRVVRDPDPGPDGCWVWTGPVNKDGYGTLAVRDASRPRGWRTVLAHRHAYESAVGPLGGQPLRHRCDNPPCVRPSHLTPGSQRQNVQDCVERGRRAPQAGSRNHHAKLTPAEVTEIRRLGGTLRNRGSVSQNELARRFGVTQAAVSSIIRGESW